MALLAAGLCLAGGGACDAQGATLPDWSGVWAMEGNTVFDHATVQPPNGRSGSPGVREFPPYTAEWEARYRQNIELIKDGRFPDPITTCGTSRSLIPKALAISLWLMG